MVEKRAIDVVLEAVGGQEELNKIYEQFWPEDGQVAYEKTSYDDEFSQEEIQRVLEKFRDLQFNKDPIVDGRTFYQFLLDDINDRRYTEFNLGENEIYHKDYLVDQICEYLVNEKGVPGEYLNAEIAENLTEQGFGIEYYFDTSSLPEKVFVDLGFQTNEEANHDSCLIYDLIYDLKHNDDYYEVDSFDNALVYLIYSQGYTVNDVLNDKKTDSVFLNSIREEIDNSFSVCNELTVCAEMDLEDWCSVVDGNANIKLTTENDSVGIYAPFSGGGSCMDIHLEKDVVLPSAFCGKSERFYRVGDCNLNVGGMSVKRVYGVGNDFYQSCETTIKPATLSKEKFRQLIQEDVKKLNEEVAKKSSSKDVAKEAKAEAKDISSNQISKKNKDIEHGR